MVIKKHMFCKIISSLICCCILVASEDVSVFAYDERNFNGFIYEYSQDRKNISIIGYEGEKSEITIPNKIDNLNVNSVYMDYNKLSDTVKHIHIPEDGKITGVSFYECKNLESINIPNGVTEIHNEAFSGCTSLRRIHIPSSVKFIGYSAFSCSGLKRLTMSKGVRYIKRGAFANCKDLSYVKLPSGLKSIGVNAFIGDYKLKKIKIPKSVVYIKSAFEKNVKINFESPYIKKYVGSQKGSDGKKYYYNVYIKGVEIQVKGKYCYKETQDILKEINKKRKAKKWREVKLSYRGLNVSMERALYLSIADCDMHERPNKTRYKYDLPSDNYIEGTVNGELKTKEQFIKEVMADTGFKNIKTIGIGCVKIGRKKYYFAVAEGRKGDKTVTKTYNDKAFMKDKAVRGDYIKKIAGKDITLKKGQTTSLNIKAKLTEKYPYNMKKYSAGKITANNLKIENMNTNIIRTDSKGNITGVKRGTAKVKVYLKMNKKCYTEFNVKVV